MKKNLLGRTGIDVTEVGMGALTMGRTQLNLPLDAGAELIRYAILRGINFIDTAQYYQTYPYIKKALSETNATPVISTKSLSCEYFDMRDAVEEARRELDRDFIDIFLLHEVRSFKDFQARKGAWEYLNEAKEKGLIRAIGMSTHHVDVAESAASIPECDVLFPLINYRSLGIRKYDRPGDKEDMAAAIRLCDEKGIGVFTMKAFGGGNLTDHYRKALDYVFSLSGVSSAMIGFGNKREIDDIFDYCEGRMPEDYNPDVAHKKIHIDQGDCEGCGACIKRCPNMAIVRNTNGLAQVDHRKCVTCGYCAPVCPVRAIVMY